VVQEAADRRRLRHRRRRRARSGPVPGEQAATRRWIGRRIGRVLVISTLKSDVRTNNLEAANKTRYTDTPLLHGYRRKRFLKSRVFLFALLASNLSFAAEVLYTFACEVVRKVLITKEGIRLFLLQLLVLRAGSYPPSQNAPGSMASSAKSATSAIANYSNTDVIHVPGASR